MKQRLPILLLVLTALLLLGGCAIEPAYRYSSTVDGGGYYSGESPYGNADTVVYGSTYYGSPWGWGPSWGYYGPGWGGVGFGVTYYNTHHHRRHGRGRHHPPAHRGHWRHSNRPPHHGNHHRSHPSHRHGHHR